MNNIEKLSIGVFFAVWIVIIVGAIGWFMNLAKLVRLDFKEPYKAEIIRIVSIIPVVGGVTGYIDIKD